MNLTNPFIELGKQRGRQEGIAEGRQEGIAEGRQEGILEGRQEGILEGRQEGQAELVLKQIARRLGAPSAAQQKAIRKLSPEKIEALGEALLDFNVPGDLARWLRQNK